MRQLIRTGALFGAVAMATLSANPLLTLSSPTDLTTLTVGQNATIKVTLSGLPVGSDFIFNLNSEESFSSSLFTIEPDPGQTSGLTPGVIFFDPSQNSNFQAASSLNAGSAIGDFSETSPSPSVAINNNGLYYSFILQAKATGSGTIAFNQASTTYAADDTGFNLAPMPTSAGLPFTISAAVTSTPEPSGLSIFCILSLTTVLAAWMRRRRTAVNQP